MWSLRWANKFTKQYKRLDSGVQQSIDKAITDMASSANPADLGTYKQDMRIFSYEIGRKYRIIYSVVYREGVIDLLRVCDHKSTYGKD